MKGNPWIKCLMHSILLLQDTITSPAVRRVRRHNNNTFAIVGENNFIFLISLFTYSYF